MSPAPMRIFNYHASAHALGAQFTRPFHHLIEVQAASALPVTGGHGHSRVDNFHFREFISFRSAHTHVSGAFQAEDGSNNTLVTSTVEGLNLMDVVTADRLVARLYSKHGVNNEEGSISIVGSEIENLRIAGHPVRVELNLELFERICTYEAAQKDYENKGDFYRIAHDPLKNGSTPQSGPNGVFLCSCVKEMETSFAGVERVGHSFSVRGFGKIFLGELTIRHAVRSLTMIRFELGSAVSGGGSAGGGVTNGHHFP
jgi:hypothetical protein